MGLFTWPKSRWNISAPSAPTVSTPFLQMSSLTFHKFLRLSNIDSITAIVLTPVYKCCRNSIISGLSQEKVIRRRQDKHLIALRLLFWLDILTQDFSICSFVPWLRTELTVYKSWMKFGCASGTTWNCSLHDCKFSSPLTEIRLYGEFSWELPQMAFSLYPLIWLYLISFVPSSVIWVWTHRMANLLQALYVTTTFCLHCAMVFTFLDMSS